MTDLPEPIEKKVVHRGFFDLYIDTLKKENQEPINYTYLSTKVNAVSVIAQDEKGRYIITKEYRHPVKKFVLSLPGGRMEKEETPEGAAMREMLEETGYEAGNLSPLPFYYPLPSICDQKIFMFHAKNCVKKTDIHLDPFEVIEVQLFEEKELLTEIQNGAEIDGVLSTALLYKNLSNMLS